MTALLAAMIAAGACGADTSGPKVGPAAKVVVSVAPIASGPVGTLLGALSVRVSDAAGVAVSGVAVTFAATGGATVSPATSTTDASGIATTQVTLGTVAGAVSVTAQAAGVASVSYGFTGVSGPVKSVVVAPKTVRFVSVGDTARVSVTAQDQYGNPAPTSAIFFSVTDATLVSVDASGLVKALRQGGSTLVISSANGKADTTTVTVLPAGSSNCTGVVGTTTLAVGDVQGFSGAQYGCLSGTATGAEFALVAFNSSVDQVSSLAVSITGTGLGTAPNPSLVPSSFALRSTSAASASSRLQLDESFHLSLLAQARARHPSFVSARDARRFQPLRSLSGTGSNASVRASGLPATVAVGDLVTLNVSAKSCTEPTNHALRVAALGTKSIVLADTLNPAGGFVTADYQRVAARFDTLVYPLDVGAFGAPSDIDGNGRVAIIFTRTVNELTIANANSFVGGFFNPRDLFPRVAKDTLENCAGSNEGEMFYLLAPDPTGVVNGNIRRTGFVDSLTTSVVAHEFQHLINASRRFYINTAATEFEATWLNEGLSHIAEELLYYRESGLTPRQNLGDAAVRPTVPIFSNDAASNFSRLGTYLTAPGANSPYASDDELATRGATWSFLRYAADQLASTDGTILQRFDNATTVGFETLKGVYGTDPTPLFRNWAVANFLDDFGTNTDTRFMHKSWNMRDIFTTTLIRYQKYPLRVTSLVDAQKADFLVRGGSAGYARLSVAAGKEGLLTFSSGGGAPSAPLQFVVVRTR
ncbi:hypothetical protein BH11GEM1_BH11GEM1_18250 [soil metagenome]